MGIETTCAASADFWRAAALAATISPVVSFASGALAQATGPAARPSSVGPVRRPNQLAAPAVPPAGAFSGAIGNIETCFLTQQGSAFVSGAVNDPGAGSAGGGVWGAASAVR